MRFRDFAIAALALLCISKIGRAQTNPKGRVISSDDSMVSASANAHFAVRVIALFYPDRIQDDSTKTGSGFYFKKGNRYFIITNEHVVRDRGYFVISFSNGGGNREGLTLTAVLRGVDDLEDVALLEIVTSDSSKLPAPAVFGNSDGLSGGEKVFARAAGEGSANVRFSTLVGRVVDPSIRSRAYSQARMIKTTIIPRPGMSGSPLMNSSGEVLGIMVGSEKEIEVRGTDTSVSVLPYSYAIPISDILSMLPQIEPDVSDTVKYAIHPVIRGIWLGHCEWPEPICPASHKVIVARVDSLGEAYGLGFKQGDIIASFDGEPIYDAIDFVTALWIRHKNGDAVEIRVLRKTGKGLANIAIKFTLK